VHASCVAFMICGTLVNTHTNTHTQRERERGRERQLLTDYTINSAS